MAEQYTRISGHRHYPVREHVAIVERVLGKRLPAGAQIHHIDKDKKNNKHGNLVVCPSQAYHSLLHRRQRSFDACGRYDWLPCKHCKVHDDPSNLVIKTKVIHGCNVVTAWHGPCDAAYQREARNRKRGVVK